MSYQNKCITSFDDLIKGIMYKNQKRRYLI